MRHLVGFAGLAFLSACSSHEVDIGWTIDGEDAAAACTVFADPTIRLTIASREAFDPRGATITETTTTTACEQGTAKVSTGNFARILVDLLDGEAIVGAADPIDVAPGAPETGAQVEQAPVAVDIGVTQSHLQAHLLVAGKSCGDAGASSFTVTLKKIVAPLTYEVIVQDADVACSDGNAVFTHFPAEVGATYLVEATTTVNSSTFTTPGEGIVPASAVTDFAVDLALVAAD